MLRPTMGRRSGTYRGERPAGRAQLLAKRGSNGEMRTPAELVPIPDASGTPDASGYFRMRSGCVGILNSGKLNSLQCSDTKFRRILSSEESSKIPAKFFFPSSFFFFYDASKKSENGKSLLF